MKFALVFSVVIFPLVACGKAVRVDNATAVPLRVSLAAFDVGVVPAGASVNLDWDFVADGVVDSSEQVVTVEGVDGAGLLATSSAFTLNESQRTLVVTLDRVAGVVAVAISEMTARPARTRWGLAVACAGFLSGLITGATFFVKRFTIETFKESL